MDCDFSKSVEQQKFLIHIKKRVSRSLIAILNNNREIIGTGFLAYNPGSSNARKGSYLLLTCHHVFSSNPSNELDLQEISNQFFFAFKGILEMDAFHLSKECIKQVLSPAILDVTVIVLKSFIAAHWMRLGAVFLESASPFIGMHICIPQLNWSEGTCIEEISIGEIVSFHGMNSLIHNLSTVPGSSGSPIITQEGFVVGIHQGYHFIGNTVKFNRVSQLNFGIDLGSTWRSVSEYPNYWYYKRNMVSNEKIAIIIEDVFRALSLFECTGVLIEDENETKHSAINMVISRNISKTPCWVNSRNQSFIENDDSPVHS